MKKNTVNYLSLILILIISISCNNKNQNDEYRDEIKIGVLLPLTGSASSTGIASQSALDFATEDINNYLSDIGSDIEIELTIKDTETNPTMAVEHVTDLQNDGLEFILGPYSSASVNEIIENSDIENTIIVSPSSVATSLAIEGDNVYRLVPSDNTQGEALTALLNSDNIEYLIPIVRNDIWGSELLQTTKSHFEATGGEMGNAIFYDTDQLDFSSEITNLGTTLDSILSEIDSEKVAIYMISFGEGTTILNQCSNVNELSSIKWYGSSAFAENSTLLEDNQAFQFALATDFICPVFGYDDTAIDKWEPLLDKLQNELGRKPEIYSLVAYDALWLAVLSYLNISEDSGISQIKASFEYESDNYFGVTGRTTLNAAGDRAYATYDFWSVDNSTGNSWVLSAKYNNANGLLINIGL